MRQETPLKRRLILHGGMPKTGTAAIQAALRGAQSRVVLESHDLYFLTRPDGANKANYSKYFHALRGLPKWRGVEQHAADVAAMSEKLRDAVGRLPVGFSVIVSAEAVGDAAARDGDGLRMLHDYLSAYFSDIVLVLYIREPLSYVSSRSQQGIKAGHAMRSALHSAVQGCNVAAIIRNASETFGERNLIIRSFDPALLTSADVVVDFACGGLGLYPASAVELSGQRGQRQDQNLGLTMDMLVILQQFYSERQIRPCNIHRGFAKTLGRINWAGAKFGPGFFSDAERQWLLTATDRARAEAVELLGYNPFPSYRPFTGTTWHPEETPPEVHRRNAELLREAIASVAAEQNLECVSRIAAAQGVTARQGDGRALVLSLLGQLYDQYDQSRRARRRPIRRP